MDSRQTISSVKMGETITHTGDLTIEGDVANAAEINVHDGALTILGSIKEGARIHLTVSEQLRHSMMNSNSVSNISMELSGVTVRSAGTFTQANMCISSGKKSLLIGNVNINNRIRSDDQVADLGGGCYQITPVSGSSYGGSLARMMGGITINGVKHVSKTVDGLATATIDGKQYQGKVIDIDKHYNVLVDGKSPSSEADQDHSSKKAKKTKAMPTLLIQGNLESSVKIKSDADVEVKGVIDSQCVVSSHYGKITAHNVYADSALDAYNEIIVDDIGNAVALTSKNSSITVREAANHVALTARDGVTIKGKALASCNVNVSSGSVQADIVGEKAVINARDGVKVAELGKYSIVTVQKGNFHGDSIGSNSRITARDKVKDSKMQRNKNTIVYNPTVFATGNNFKEANEEFKQVLDAAPKPGDFPGRVVVAPRFVVPGVTINVADLLEQYNNKEMTEQSDSKAKPKL